MLSLRTICAGSSSAARARPRGTLREPTILIAFIRLEIFGVRNFFAADSFQEALIAVGDGWVSAIFIPDGRALHVCLHSGFRTYRALTNRIAIRLLQHNALKRLVGPAGIEPATTPL
jgi:hypothetical protein